MAAISAGAISAAKTNLSIDEGSVAWQQAENDLKRIAKGSPEIDTSDAEIVRLYIALRKLRGEQIKGGRVTVGMMQKWKATAVKKTEVEKRYVCVSKVDCPRLTKFLGCQTSLSSSTT